VRVWRYREGHLSPFEASWASDATLEERGYARLFDLGDTWHYDLASVSAEVYERVPEAQASELTEAYLVMVNLGSAIETVLVPDFPQLTAYLLQLQPLIQLAMETEKRRQKAEVDGIV